VATLALAASLSIGLVAGWSGHAGATGAAGVANGARPVATRVHVVREGETLWGIARGVVGSEGDPRPVVDALAAANHLRNAFIVPGQRLVVPSSV